MSGNRQAPSGRQPVLAPHVPCGACALGRMIAHSHALPQGSPHGHARSGAWQRLARPSRPATVVLPPQPQMRPFRGTLGHSRRWGGMGTCLSWDWALLGTFTVDTLLQRRGPAGSIPNSETCFSAPARNEKSPQSAASSRLSGRPGRASTLGAQGLSTRLSGPPSWQRADSRPSELERTALSACAQG